MGPVYVANESGAPWYIRSFVPTFVFILGMWWVNSFSKRVFRHIDQLSARNPISWAVFALYLGVIVVTIGLMLEL